MPNKFYYALAYGYINNSNYPKCRPDSNSLTPTTKKNEQKKEPVTNKVSKFVKTILLSKLIDKTSISAIVTECTLGPMYGKFPKDDEIAKNFADLKKLYTECFKDFSKFLPQKAKIVMCVPAYRRGRDNYVMMETLDWAKELGYNLLELIPKKIANRTFCLPCL